MAYNLIENNLCDVDEFYRKLGLKYILYSDYRIGEELDLESFKEMKTLNRIVQILEEEEAVILELINKKTNVEL
jgi:hypothetical protein